ncbi:MULTISPECIES: hypothetical protein [unclassified Rickettsia]
MSLGSVNSVVAWLEFLQSVSVSSSCLTHYCTNVEKRLCHAVT